MNTLDDVQTPETVCQICKKEPGREPHSCPYKEDVNNDPYTLCNCCEKCAQECCDDI